MGGMARREVVPFKCGEWGGEFAATAGGLSRPPYKGVRQTLKVMDSFMGVTC